jgi:hypothetical protein
MVGTSNKSVPVAWPLSFQLKLLTLAAMAWFYSPREMIYPGIPSRLYPWLYIIEDLPAKNGHLPTKKCDLPTTNCDLPTTNCDLPTKNCDLPTKNCDLPTKNDDLPTTNGDLPTKNCDLH